MKILMISYVLMLSGCSLATQEKSEFFSDEGENWDHNLDNMLEFDKSIIQDVNGPSEKELKNGNIQVNTMVTDLMKFDSHVGDQLQCKKFQKDTINYIKRYINFFLVTSGLQVLPETGDVIKVDLEFSIAKQDLLFLHNLSKGFSIEKIRNNLQKIDEIFEAGLHLKEENFFYKTVSVVEYLSSYMNHISTPFLYESKSFYYILIVVITLVMTLFTNISKVFTVIIMLNNFILLEGIMDYVYKKKLADTEDLVRKLRTETIADACDPDKRSLWSYFTEFFGSDKCLNYHMKLMESKTVEVSPLKCILDAYDTIIFQYPFKVFGEAIRTFSENVNASMPFKTMFVYFTNIFIIILVFLILLFLYRPYMRLHFFGVGLDFGFFHPRLISPPTSPVEGVENQTMKEIEGSESNVIKGDGLAKEKENIARLKEKDSTAEESSKNGEESDPELSGNKCYRSIEEVSENRREVL